MEDIFYSIPVFEWAAVILYAFAIFGCLYALVAAWLARKFYRSEIAPAKSFPAVTILKPLHGIEHELYENLARFCVQKYPGRVQIIFGVDDPADPAIEVVRKLIVDFPDRDLELLVNSHRHGTNRKVSNLINMESKARYDVLVLSDSDIIVEPDYLNNIVATLDAPGVGVVTCLYQGAPTAGLWACLAAAAINYHFLPGVLVGIKFGLAKPCFGSTIAISKNTLVMIGGFKSVVDELADDYAIGKLVRREGLTVAIPHITVTHVCAHKTARDLFQHELRWARTIRFVDAFGYIGSAVTHALPLALLGTLLAGVTPVSIIVIAALACRFLLQTQIDRGFGLRDSSIWMGPFRDLLSFVIFLASFFGRAVEWRGHWYTLRPDNMLVYAGEIDP